MKLDLENKIALVTGGGRDIGKLTKVIHISEIKRNKV